MKLLGVSRKQKEQLIVNAQNSHTKYFEYGEKEKYMGDINKTINGEESVS